MNDRFAHRLRLDQIRDGERLDLVADDAERTGSPSGWGCSRSTGSRRTRRSRRDG